MIENNILVGNILFLLVIGIVDVLLHFTLPILDFY